MNMSPQRSAESQTRARFADREQKPVKVSQEKSKKSAAKKHAPPIKGNSDGLAKLN